MSEQITYNEFYKIYNDFRSILIRFFITKGVYVKFEWDSSIYTTVNKTEFTWEGTVCLRKYCLLDGTLVKPNIEFSDNHRIDDIYSNLNHMGYASYYNHYPEIFPRFLYNRNDLRDVKENGVGTQFIRKIGKFRLFVTNYGDVKVKDYVRQWYDNMTETSYTMYNLDQIKISIPEYDILIDIIKEYFSHKCEFVRIRKRNSIISHDLYMAVENKQFEDRKYLPIDKDFSCH
jgi:hypothetical protein